MQVSNLNLFYSILTPCKWPQIEMLFLHLIPGRFTQALTILGSKSNWFYIWINLWAICVEKQKNMILYIRRPEPTHRLRSMIEKQTHQFYAWLLFRAYILTILWLFPSIPNHVTYLSKNITYVTHLYSRE